MLVVSKVPLFQLKVELFLGLCPISARSTGPSESSLGEIVSVNDEYDLST